MSAQITCVAHFMLTVNARPSPDAVPALHGKTTPVEVFAWPADDIPDSLGARCEVREEACRLDVRQIALRVRALLK